MTPPFPLAPPMILVRPYDRAERLSDALVHLIGLTLALCAVPVLVALAAVWRGDTLGIVGVSVYGATLISMLSASLAYNHTPYEEWTSFLRRLDHSMIALKIAGTVTPFVLFSGSGITFLVGMWAAAVAATVVAFWGLRRTSTFSVVIGLAMGWAVLFAGGEVIAAISTPVFALMVAGGVIYSLGTPFLLWRSLRFHNAIWHAFVVSASIVFFVAVMWHLVATSVI